MNLFKRKPAIRCEDCAFYAKNKHGTDWDRCKHPDTNSRNTVRNERERCYMNRMNGGECGPKAKLFVGKFLKKSSCKMPNHY